MWKYFIIGLLTVFIGVLCVEVFLFGREKHNLEAQLNSIRSDIKKLEIESADIQDQIKYFSNDANLEKELRSKFNYRKPDEKMMIIVP